MKKGSSVYVAIFWKEFREQSLILLALVVMGSGVIIAAATFGEDRGIRDTGSIGAYTSPGRLSTLALAVAAGTVIGGTLFAGERENGTYSFLEQLPLRPRGLFRAKVGAGFLLTSFTSIVLLGVGTALGVFGSIKDATTWWALGYATSLGAFGWGTFGSATTRSTLAACAFGLLVGTAISMVSFPLIGIVARTILRDFGFRYTVSVAEQVVLVAIYILIVLPFILALLTYPYFTARMDRSEQPTKLNRSQKIREEREERVQTKIALVRTTPSLARALVWLTFQQVKTIAMIGIVISIVIGLAMVPTQVPILALWPGVSLGAALLASVLIWNDEQPSGAYFFWGERRFPAMALLISKLSAGLLLTLIWCGFMILPSFIKAYLTPGDDGGLLKLFRSGLMSMDRTTVWIFLLIWPMYGFSLGTLAAVLFRKTIIAISVGALSASPLAALWMPSLILGGLHHWQVWPVPVISLLLTALLIREWSSDRLGSWWALRKIAISIAAVVLVSTLLIGYRAIEVPNIPESNLDREYAKTIPALDFDDSGRDFRRASAVFFKARTIPQFVNGFARYGTFSEIIPDVASSLAKGYLRPDPIFEQNMNLLLESEWLQVLKESIPKPGGPIENPSTLTHYSPLPSIVELPLMTAVMLSHGLIQNSKGKPDEFVTCLEAALIATRNGRIQQPHFCHVEAENAERLSLQGIRRFLESPIIPEASLRELTRVLEDHQKLCPAPREGADITEQLILRNMMKAPSQWAPQDLYTRIVPKPKSRPTFLELEPKLEFETNLFGFAAAVPWEDERMARVVGLGNTPESRLRILDYQRGTFASVFQYPEKFRQSIPPSNAVEFRELIEKTQRRLNAKD